VKDTGAATEAEEPELATADAPAELAAGLDAPPPQAATRMPTNKRPLIRRPDARDLNICVLLSCG